MLFAPKKTVTITYETDLALRGLGGRTRLGVGGVLDVIVFVFSRELSQYVGAEDLLDVPAAEEFVAPHGSKEVEVSEWAADYLEGVSGLTGVSVHELVSLVMNRGGKRVLDNYSPMNPAGWSGFGAQLRDIVANAKTRPVEVPAVEVTTPAKAGKRAA